MKRCYYCGKEISYMEQYCCEDCARKAVQFYERNEKFQKLFSVMNAVCVMAIPIGIFLFSLVNDVGFAIVAFAVLLLGITDTLLPFPVENMITKFKIQKAEKITRIIALIVLALGIVLTALFFIFFI